MGGAAKLLDEARPGSWLSVSLSFSFPSPDQGVGWLMKDAIPVVGRVFGSMTDLDRQGAP